MHDACDEQSVGDAEALGDRVKTCAAIVIDVLTGIEHIKTADPQSDCCTKDQHAKVETAGDGNPRGRGRNAESKAEENVRPVREAFGEGIEKKDGDGEGSEL